MDFLKLDQSSIDAIAYKAAKIVVSEMKKGEQTPTEMVPVSEAARILGISEDHMRRIKDKFPHIKNGNNKQGRLLFVRDALLKNMRSKQMRTDSTYRCVIIKMVYK